MLDHRHLFIFNHLIHILTPKVSQFRYSLPPILLITSRKDLERQIVRQELSTTDLETIRNSINRLNLILRQVPTIERKVGVDSLWRDALGDDAPALGETP